MKYFLLIVAGFVLGGYWDAMQMHWDFKSGTIQWSCIPALVAPTNIHGVH